jgi:hypothetical protein
VRGDGLSDQVDVALDFFLCPADTGEAVAVGPLDLVL